jgi:hypothetical protein
MRRAALDAGMIQEESSAKLVLCLEPEAACMACKEQRLAGAGAAGMNVLKIDDTFMVTTLLSSLYILLTALTALIIVFASHPLSMFCTHGLPFSLLPL